MAAPTSVPSPRRRRNPWWIPPFLGRVPDVDDQVLRVLALVSLALFFEQYDMGMLTSTLKLVKDDLGFPEDQLGAYLSLVRLGAVPALFLVPIADRLGRRKLFLASLIGVSVATFLTAFTQTPPQYLACQMIGRMFMISCGAMALVIVTEEFPAAHRGWGIGILGALGAAGHGLAAVLFGFVESLPFGWRFLYGVGIVPLLLLPRLRRGIPETRRFEEHRNSREEQPRGGPLRPLLDFLFTYPGRAFLVALSAGLGAVGGVAAFQFSVYYAQEAHGWEPGQIAFMVVFGGAVGIIGNVAAGRLGDVFGRRIVGAGFFATLPAFVWLYYAGPGWALPLGWIGLVFCATAGAVITRALATELFPTSHRGTAAGWLALVDTVGAAAGLFLLSLGNGSTAQISEAVRGLSLLVAVAGLVFLWLPETNRRELEEISPELGH